MKTGCGKQTHVSGTNGGTLPCGSPLKWPDGTETFELCPHCEPGIFKVGSRVVVLKTMPTFADLHEELDDRWRAGSIYTAAYHEIKARLRDGLPFIVHSYFLAVSPNEEDKDEGCYELKLSDAEGVAFHVPASMVYAVN